MHDLSLAVVITVYEAAIPCSAPVYAACSAPVIFGRFVDFTGLFGDFCVLAPLYRDLQGQRGGEHREPGSGDPSIDL